jgi:hypothetical protein
MTSLPDEMLPEDEEAAALLFRALASPDDATELMEQACDAFLRAVNVRWGRRLCAAKALLAAAEAALDRAEASDDFDERRRELQIFELYMAAATEVDC